MALTIEQARTKRDAKILDSLAEFAPIWLTDDTYRENEEALLFNLVYAHPLDGMVKERFKYDAFNDVLYHMGGRLLSESELLDIEAQPPYIDGEVLTRVPNAPQFRAPRPRGV
jgi:hypothetical protein